MAVERVTSEQLSYPGDGLHYRHGQPFTGVLEFRRPGGGLESEEEYKDGLPWGRTRVWDSSGTLLLDAECAWGGYHGTVREWHDNGTPAADEVYEYGIRTRGRRWDEQGRTVEEFELSEADPDYRTLELARAAFGTGPGEGGGAG